MVMQSGIYHSTSVHLGYRSSYNTICYHSASIHLSVALYPGPRYKPRYESGHEANLGAYQVPTMVIEPRSTDHSCNSSLRGQLLGWWSMDIQKQLQAVKHVAMQAPVSA